MTRLEVRPTTRQDFIDFHGVPPPYRMRALTALEDGTVIGIAGLQYVNGNLIAFSDTCPAIKSRKKFLMRFAKTAMQMCEEETRPIYAIADENEPTAPRWLARHGFTNIESDLYLWHRHS